MNPLEEQRRNFAYGNVAIGNPAVTREMVDEAAEELERESQDWLDAEHYEGLVAGKAIEIVCRETGICLNELAPMLGVGKTTLYRWVRGAGRPSFLDRRALWELLPEIWSNHKRGDAGRQG